MCNQFVSWAVGCGDASTKLHSLAIRYSLKSRCISNQTRSISDSWHLILSKPIGCLLQPRYNRVYTLQKKVCFNHLELSQWQLHYQAMCYLISVSNFRQHTKHRSLTNFVYLLWSSCRSPISGKHYCILCDSCIFPGAIDLLQMQLHCYSYVASCNYCEGSGLIVYRSVRLKVVIICL